MKHFNTTNYKFDGSRHVSTATLETSIDLLRKGRADAIVLDIVSEDCAEDFWQDNNESLPKSHQHHSLLSASGVTMGQLQREVGQSFTMKFASYVANSVIENKYYEKTSFIDLFKTQLNAKPYALTDNVELLIATKRIYRKNVDAKFNFLPHVDNISFARERELWPVEDPECQFGAFFLVQGSDNDAPFVLWDKEVNTRTELDSLARKFKQENFSDLNEIPSIEITPRPGQLTIFSSKRLHAVGQCESERRTIGTFLVPKDDAWFLCH